MNQIKYDVIYILDPNATAEEMAAVSSKVETIVADAKGTVLKKDEWGKRRLAYLVQKHRDGHFVFFHVSVSTETIAEITRNLRLMEKVIKFSVVKDTISHLKPLPKPVRRSAAPGEGTTGRPYAPRPGSSSHRAPSPSTSAPSAPAASAPAAAPAPEAPAAPAAPSTPTV